MKRLTRSEKHADPGRPSVSPSEPLPSIPAFYFLWGDQPLPCRPPKGGVGGVAETNFPMSLWRLGLRQESSFPWVWGPPETNFHPVDEPRAEVTTAVVGSCEECHDDGAVVAAAALVRQGDELAGEVLRWDAGPVQEFLKGWGFDVSGQAVAG